MATSMETPALETGNSGLTVALETSDSADTSVGILRLDSGDLGRLDAPQLRHPKIPSERHMYLGIDQQTGLVYEGSDGPVLPAVPTPSVTQAKLIEAPQDWGNLPGGIVQSPFSWTFREDTFDARPTRTGRRSGAIAVEVGLPIRSTSASRSRAARQLQLEPRGRPSC